jgi:FkbM family methyltransferase
VVPAAPFADAGLGGPAVSREEPRPRRRLGNRIETWLLERTFALLARNRAFRRLATRRLFAEHFHPSAMASVELDGQTFHVDPRDRTIAFRLLSGEPWQRRELEQAIAIARMQGGMPVGKLFLDIGANIGTQTLYASATGAFAGAVAIEAEPANARLLQRNVSDNGLAGRVRVLSVAVSDREGVARLTLDAENHGKHSLEAGMIYERGATIEVRTARLDVLLAEQGLAADAIGFVWMDVEGHEIAALAGMADVLAGRPPLAIEVSGGHLGPAGRARLLELLRPHYSRYVDIRAPKRTPRRALAEASVGTALAGAGEPRPLAELDLDDRQRDLLLLA